MNSPESIKIKIRKRGTPVSDVVKITPEAQIVLQRIVTAHGCTARELVSQLIVQGENLLEFVNE